MSKLQRRDLSPKEEIRVFKELREIHAWSRYETGCISNLRYLYQDNDVARFLLGVRDLKQTLRDKIDALERLQKDLWEEVDE